VEVRVPDIGDFKDVAVIEVLASRSATRVKLEQSLITVESDKASMEIPSSAAGVLKELKVKVGDKVNIGDLVAILEGSVWPAACAPQQCCRARVAAPASCLHAALAAHCGRCTACVRPMHPARRADSGCRTPRPRCASSPASWACHWREVKGSGPKGRITEADVQGFTTLRDGRRSADGGSGRSRTRCAAAGGDGAGLGLIPWPKVDFAKFGPIERKDAEPHQEDQRRQPAAQLR